MPLVVSIVFVCLGIPLVVLACGRRVLKDRIDPEYEAFARGHGLVFGFIARQLSQGVPRGPGCSLMLWGEFLVLRGTAPRHFLGYWLRTRIAVAYGSIFHFLAKALAHVSAHLERLALLELVVALASLASMRGPDVLEDRPLD